MGSRGLLVALLACACRAPTAASNVGAARQLERTVVVLSLDGFRHDYATLAPTPTFSRLAREGARASRLLPPFPTVTFPAHATLATGAPAEVHGLIANQFKDRVHGVYNYTDAPRWYDVAPLWIHATARGLQTHVFHWVGSAGAYRGVEPAIWRRYDASISDDAKLTAIIEWLARPADRRPRLIMSYLNGCDAAGHEHGPESAEVRRCIIATDKRLQRLLQRLTPLAGRVTLFILSDHGMTRTIGELNMALALARAGITAEVFPAGGVANIYLAPNSDRAAALRTAAAVPHSTAYAGSNLPQSFRYRHAQRTGDLVVVSDPGYMYSQAQQLVVGPPRLGGHHGHAPEHPDMGAIFYTWGAGVVPGAVVDTVHARDLVPTICALLGIAAPPYAEGRRLNELVRR